MTIWARVEFANNPLLPDRQVQSWERYTAKEIFKSSRNRTKWSKSLKYLESALLLDYIHRKLVSCNTKAGVKFHVPDSGDGSPPIV